MPSKPMVLTELPFVTAHFGYKIQEGQNWRETLLPDFWLADHVIRRLKACDTIRVIDENGPVIVDLLVLSANPYAERVADKLSLAPTAVYPPGLELPAPAPPPEFRIRYARATDLYEIVSMDGLVVDQLVDQESALRTVALMTRHPAPVEPPAGETVLAVALREAAPRKPRRGRPRKAPARSADAEPAPDLAAAAHE